MLTSHVVLKLSAIRKLQPKATQARIMWDISELLSPRMFSSSNSVGLQTWAIYSWLASVSWHRLEDQESGGFLTIVRRCPCLECVLCSMLSHSVVTARTSTRTVYINHPAR